VIYLKRILIVGASGMLGNTLLRYFFNDSDCQVFGTVRSLESISSLSGDIAATVTGGVTIESTDSILKVFSSVQPDIVINCLGLVKQLSDANSPLLALPINSIFPHRLAEICSVAGARLIHMSTDCVFSGKRGMYLETDVPDAQDLYGVSKRLGEVDYPHAITLRTSIIGHELSSHRSLVNWFLGQSGQVKGFSNAIFSGLPTVEIGKLIKHHVIPHGELHGMYHVSAEPIDKYTLLCMVKRVYGKSIEILRDSEFSIDRSLDSTRFRDATGFVPAGWEEMVQTMHDFN
jgi:dTDP-4-dehydrorhamnose reductase